MKLPFLLALLCLLYSNSDGQDKPSILIGSGGGITGMTTVYHITQSGEVLKGKGVGEIKYTECGRMKRSKARKMISRVATAVSSTNFDHPGNMYYFFTLKENDGEKKITWGDIDHTVPDNVKTLYEEIHTSVTALTYKPIKKTN